MSESDASLRSSYEIHGVAVEVVAQDPAVVEAMELRLRGFPRGTPASAPVVRLHFTTCDGPGRWANPADGRPVYDAAHGSLHYSDLEGALYGAFGGVTLRCEAARGTAWLASARFTGTDLYIATHPLATVSLMELLERRGLFSLHAACLASDAGGVLLSGPSGSGKSTLTVALARAGLGVLSDDVVFLSLGGPGAVRALAFADAVGLTPYAAKLFPELAPVMAEPLAAGFPKRLVRPEELLETPGPGSCRPTALVFPEVTPGRLSHIEPLDPGEALLRLVPDVLLTDATATQAHLAAIAALLDQVSCFALGSGADLERAAKLVQALA